MHVIVSNFGNINGMYFPDPDIFPGDKTDMRIYDLNYVTSTEDSVNGGIFRLFGRSVTISNTNFSQSDSSSQSASSVGGRPITISNSSSIGAPPRSFLQQLLDQFF